MNILIMTTGGTIEKSYQPATGEMRNTASIIPELLTNLRLPDFRFTYYKLWNKDSLELKEEDYRRAAQAIFECSKNYDGILVTHGTDRMAEVANTLYQKNPVSKIPVIFTGAMIPYVVDGSDALQNVTESLIAFRLVTPGIYIVFHNRVLPVPQAVKDYENGTFTQLKA